MAEVNAKFRVNADGAIDQAVCNEIVSSIRVVPNFPKPVCTSPRRPIAVPTLQFLPHGTATLTGRPAIAALRVVLFCFCRICFCVCCE